MIKLHNVPLMAYSEDGLSLITIQVGKPIMLDAFTSFMCVDSWGHISFACALIELSLDYELKREVIMAIPKRMAVDIMWLLKLLIMFIRMKRDLLRLRIARIKGRMWLLTRILDLLGVFG